MHHKAKWWHPALYQPMHTLALTLAAVTVALIVRLALDPVLADDLPFVTFYIAVAFAAWLGGLRPALIAMGLGLLLSWYFFIPPRGSFDITTTADAVGLFMYLTVSMSFAAFGEAMWSALRRAELRRSVLQTTFASIGDGVITTDDKGRVTYLNAQAEALTGWRTEEAAGRPLREVFVIIKESNRSPADNPAERVLREGAIVGLANHTLLVARDGTERPIDDSAAPIREADGRLYGCVLVFRDDSKRRQTEDALRQSEARMREYHDELQGIYRQAPIGLAMLDRELRWVRINDQLAAMNGLPAEAHIGQRLCDLLPDLADNLEPQFRKILDTGEPMLNVELTGETPAAPGEQRTWLESWLPQRNSAGEIVGVSALVTEITERKRSEVEIRAKNQRLELLWDTAAVLLGANDPDEMLKSIFHKVRGTLGVDMYLNYVADGQSLQLTSSDGLGDDTLIGLRRFDYGQTVCGWVAERREPLALSHLQSRPDPRAEGVRALGMDAYLCFPLLSDGELLGTLSFGSRNKPAFADDEAATLATIARYVGMAYERLRLVRQLREADRRKDEFLATLAHELRGPLAPLRNVVEITRRLPEDPATQALAREIMDRQVAQLVRLVDDLLDISRITRNKLPLRCEPADLGELVRNAIEDTRSQFTAAGHDLVVEQPAEPLLIHADQVRISQVIGNLLTNACKYTPPGGRIAVALRGVEGAAELRIADNGVGIPVDRLDSIFEMFGQVDTSLERTQGGLGIGLALVRRLVELHGGTVEAHSEGSGAGSEFLVRLPLDSPATNSPPTARV